MKPKHILKAVLYEIVMFPVVVVALITAPVWISLGEGWEHIKELAAGYERKEKEKRQ